MTGPVGDQTGRSAGLELARELWARRKWPALVAFAAAFAAVVSLAIWLPDLYRASATVAIEAQQLSEAFVHSTVTSELETRLPRIEQELMSRARLGSLIAQLDLYGDQRKKGVPLDVVIDQMRKDLDVDLQGVDQQAGRRGPIAFRISYIGRDPETVAQVANVLAALYVEENSRMRAGQAVRTAEVLKAQLAEVKKELDAQDRRASEFRLGHLGELPQQVEANLGSLERLNTQLRMNAEAQIRVMERRDRLENQAVGAGAAAPTDTVASPNATELARLRQELAALRHQYSEAYPDVIRVKALVEALERRDAGSRVPSTAAPADATSRLTQALQETQRERVALKEEEMALRRAIATYEQRMDNMPKRQQEFQALSRDYESIKERYDTLQKRYEEAQLAESLEQGQKVEQFRILDSAIPPRTPGGPGRMRLIVAGLIFSIVFAVGTVLAAERLDTSFHSAEDLRTFARGMTLFSIPLIQTAADARRRWRQVALATGVVVVGLAVIVVGCRYVATGNDRIARLVSRGHV